jgi:hypothetical protein
MHSTEELNQLMTEAATDAVNYINENFERQVTLCQQDLEMVDMALGQLALQHIQSPLRDEELYTACSILGAFVGEVFKQTAGGEWFMDRSVPDAPFVVLNYAGRSYPFASVCYEKIANDQQISLMKYFELALGNQTN